MLASFGQLGDGPFNNSHIPIQVISLSGRNNWYLHTSGDNTRGRRGSIYGRIIGGLDLLFASPSIRLLVQYYAPQTE